MSAKHTPGPWTAALHIPHGSADGDPIVRSASGLTICVMAEGDEGAHEADQRLIAAAPELLAALAIAWELLPAIPPDHDHRAHYEKIRAAIAKATGAA